MTYKIENNVPLPTHRQGATSTLPLTIKSLKKGQSFLCEDRCRATIQSAVHRSQIESGAKFTVAKEGNGFRIFRIS